MESGLLLPSGETSTTRSKWLFIMTSGTSHYQCTGMVFIWRVTIKMTEFPWWHNAPSSRGHHIHMPFMFDLFYPALREDSNRVSSSVNQELTGTTVSLLLNRNCKSRLTDLVYRSFPEPICRWSSRSPHSWWSPFSLRCQIWCRVGHDCLWLVPW